MTVTAPIVNVLRITIGGRPLPDHLAPSLKKAWVDDNLNLPDQFVLEFHDPDRNVLARSGAQFGAAVELRVVTDREPAGQVLLHGEVTAVEAEYDPLGSKTIVRGYDKSHRLFRGCRTAAYPNRTAADIARRVASRAGVQTGRIDPTPTVLAHVSQVNENDWQFLSRLANEIGFEVAVREGRLDFRLPAQASAGPAPGNHDSTDPLQLHFGRNLLRFRSGITAAEQVREVEVRAWDPARKRAIVGRAQASTAGAQAGIAPADVAARFDPPVLVEVDTPHATEAEANAAAGALSEKTAGASVSFEGVARGSPKLRAGGAVSLGLVGAPFDGRYVLTTTRHLFDYSGGAYTYTTSFTVTGRQEQSLLNLSSGGLASSRGSGRRPWYGVYPAVVTDGRDPDNLCRVKLKFPWLSDDYVSDWSRICTMGAGNQRGFVVLPEVGDEVLVAFEHGDVRRPYVIGSLFNGVDRPWGNRRVDRATGAVRHWGIRTKSGMEVVLTDADDQKAIDLSTAQQHGFLVNQTNHEVKVSSEDTMNLGARGRIVIHSTGGAVRIESAQGLEIRAGGQLSLHGSSVSITSDGQTEITGRPIRLN